MSKRFVQPVLYAIAPTIADGLNSTFSSGPYHSFPVDDYLGNPSSFVFRIDKPKPVLAYEMMKDVAAGRPSHAQLLLDAQKYWYEVVGNTDARDGLEAEDLQCAAIAETEQFSQYIIGELGVNTGGFDEVLGRHITEMHASGPSLDSNDTRELISAIDELMAGYAHDFKYVTQSHDGVAREIALWAKFRAGIMSQIDANKQEPVAQVEQITQQSQVEERPRTKPKFDFRRPRG